MEVFIKRKNLFLEILWYFFLLILGIFVWVNSIVMRSQVIENRKVDCIENFVFFFKKNKKEK